MAFELERPASEETLNRCDWEKIPVMLKNDVLASSNPCDYKNNKGVDTSNLIITDDNTDQSNEVISHLSKA